MTRRAFAGEIGPMIKVLTLLVVMSCWLPSGAEASPQKDFFQQFETPFMKLVPEGDLLAQWNPGRYPSWLSALITGPFAPNPLAERQGFTPECSPQVLSQRLQDPRLKSVQLQGALLQRYFSQCREAIQTGVRSDWHHVLRTLALRWSPQEHPFFHRVVLHFSPSVRLKGYLALKGDLKPRPFVVFRLGVNASAEEFFGEKSFVMQLFEQGPFNLLVLENTTSPDFIANNPRFSMGGFDEGIQNIKLAQFLRDPRQKLSRIISSLHFVGVSLGGHGVLLSSLLSDANSPASMPLIDSSLLLCPVVDLKKTFEALVQPGVKTKAVDWWLSQRLAGLEGRLSETPPLFKFVPTMVSTLEKRSGDSLLPVHGLKWPQGFNPQSQFWQRNDFAPWLPQIKQPVLVLVTDKDTMVPPEINGLTLRGQNLRTVKVPEGQHCSLNSAYDWNVMTSIFHGFLLSHAPHFKAEPTSLLFPVEPKVGGRGDISVDISFPKDSSKYVKLTLAGAIKKQELNLPISAFEFNFLNSQLTEIEKSMLVRWLNYNLQIDLKERELQLSWSRVASAQNGEREAKRSTYSPTSSRK